MMETDIIVQGDALQELNKVPTGCVDLVLTSPPYNAGKIYEQKLTEQEYFDFINPIAKEFKRILKPDGRFAINVCFNINRINVVGDRTKNSVLYPFLSWIDSLRANGLTIKENIIWDQLNSECDTAWGSWKSASAPHIRHQTENILVGYNQQWKKLNKGISDITPTEFTRWTLDKWRFGCERNRQHPAPYPEELAKRCIKLFSYVDDLVLDPFNGSGTTCAVAKMFNRKYIGIDQSAEYCQYANKRIDNIPFKLENYSTQTQFENNGKQCAVNRH